MQEAIGKEVDIRNLIPGERYYAFSTRDSSNFVGIFTHYWTNTVGYSMLRFHYVNYKSKLYTGYIGSPEKHPHGSYWRIFEDGQQSYRYYRVSRFTEKEKKELIIRYTLRERRQYERGLTGSTPNDLWFPRDLVRHISLKYLTDPKIANPKRRV